jgi:hypothetical protein
MKHKEIVTVDQTDFLTTIDQNKKFEEIDLYDFDLSTETIKDYDIIIYLPLGDTRCKVLKKKGMRI